MRRQLYGRKTNVRKENNHSPFGSDSSIQRPCDTTRKRPQEGSTRSKRREGLLQAMSIIDGLIAILVEEWSFDMLPPAVSIKSLEELTMADYDALSAEASKRKMFYSLRSLKTTRLKATLIALSETPKIKMGS
jgi:hypothetical protein